MGGRGRWRAGRVKGAGAQEPARRLGLNGEGSGEEIGKLQRARVRAEGMKR